MTSTVGANVTVTAVTRDYKVLHYYINHSTTPNTILRGVFGDLDLVTNHEVNSGEELTLNYWDHPNWLAKPNHPKYGFVEL